jgi:RNA polymerase sigma-54 factor
MALTTKLDLRQGQQLVMTPQLQQAIRLLQYSNLELSQFIEGELERNPLLELEEPTAESSSAREDATADASSGEPDADGTGSSEEDWLDLDKPVTDAVAVLDTELENVYPDAPASDIGPDLVGSWASLTPRNGALDEDPDLEDYVANEISLREHLEAQMVLVLADPAERLIAHNLIDTVDDAGYLRADLEELQARLAAPAGMVERVLGVLQSLDPPGVCARSLAECLALQLKEKNRYDPQIAALLDNLSLIATHNLAALRKAIGVDDDELAEMISEIKTLDPKPGLRFGRVQVQPVVPDIIVRPGNDGSWLIELNSETLPRVLVNRVYYARVSKTARNDKDKGYLLECLQTANWLVKSLDQRARTILKVAEEIVRQQDAFFAHGVAHLKPMNLKSVADAISMHESTVSRVTSNKYVATPRGILELKYFFTSSISAADGDGEAHSSEAVRHRIRQMIDAEPPAAVLSDDMIVDLLRRDGIDIARRTVAKYREAMRIPSSVQRRRQKRLSERAGRAV